jgi:hypothetical protein
LRPFLKRLLAFQKNIAIASPWTLRCGGGGCGKTMEIESGVNLSVNSKTICRVNNQEKSRNEGVRNKKI